MLKCFWNIHHLLKPFLNNKRLSDLVNYQTEFANMIHENAESMYLLDGSEFEIWRRNKQLAFIEQDDLLNVNLKKQLSDLGLPIIDIRKVWTHLFPKQFFKKPAVVDWEHERLFEVDDCKTVRKYLFYDRLEYI